MGSLQGRDCSLAHQVRSGLSGLTAEMLRNLDDLRQVVNLIKVSHCTQGDKIPLLSPEL